MNDRKKIVIENLCNLIDSDSKLKNTFNGDGDAISFDTLCLIRTAEILKLKPPQTESEVLQQAKVEATIPELELLFSAVKR